MEECPICLKDIECESVCDKCSLKTCKECIENWRRKKSSCPQCRHSSNYDPSIDNLIQSVSIDIGGFEIDSEYGEWIEIWENQNP